MRCGTLGASPVGCLLSHGASGHVTTKPSIGDWGVLYKSGVYAWKVICSLIEPGTSLHLVACAVSIGTEGGEIWSDRCAGVSRGHMRREEQASEQARMDERGTRPANRKSRSRKLSTETGGKRMFCFPLKVRTVWVDNRRGCCMNMRPSNQLWLPLESEGDMFGVNADSESPSEDEGLMERVVERENLFRALKRVQDNGGNPGVDGVIWHGVRQSQRMGRGD